jgi:peptidase E
MFESVKIPKKLSHSPIDQAIFDAISRYKLVNSTDSYDTASAKLFLTMLESFSYRTMPHITLYEDAVKARITYKYVEFIIDYDFEEPESVFISAFEGDKLIIKDGPIKDIFKILESF